MYIRLIFNVCKIDTIEFNILNNRIVHLCAKIGTFEKFPRAETHHGAFVVAQHGLGVMRKY